MTPTRLAENMFVGVALPTKTTPTEYARSISSSEAAATGGKKPLTPIIAGGVCGGVMLLAWIIGFGIYFRKRYNRKKRKRLIAAGKAAPREKDLQIPKEKIVIPPDPAVLLGQRQPGEQLFPERAHSKDGHSIHLPWSCHPSRENTQPPAPATSAHSSRAQLTNHTPPLRTSIDGILPEETADPKHNRNHGSL